MYDVTLRVAEVPTGMNTGVSITLCGRESRATLALVTLHWASTSKVRASLLKLGSAETTEAFPDTTETLSFIIVRMSSLNSIKLAEFAFHKPLKQEIQNVY